MVGLGLDPSTFRVLDEKAWTALVSMESPQLDRIDGHFVVAKITEAAVCLFTDQLGIKALYYGHWQGGIVFSTRYDWLSILLGGLDIDFEAFGSHWTALNQLSTKSSIKGLSRMSASGILTISGKKGAIRQSKAVEFETGESDRIGAAFTEAIQGIVA